MLGDKFRPPAPSPSAVAQSRMVSMGTCTRLSPERQNGEEGDVCLFVCVFFFLVRRARVVMRWHFLKGAYFNHDQKELKHTQGR